MRARKIFLLAFILLAGASIETTWRLRNHMDFGPLGWRVFGGRFYGPSFPFEASRTEDVAPGAGVSVDNAFGSVRVSQGEPGRVRIALRKVVFLPTQAEAAALAEQVEIRARSEGATLEVGTNREDLESSGALASAGLETHLEIAVPPGTAVSVRNEHGRIEVADVASADVDGSFDSVQVERVAGDAEVKAQHGDILVASVGGALTLSSRHGDVHLKDLAGHATGDVEHGKLRAERTGALTLEMKHGRVDANGVRGGLEVRGEHVGVRASDVAGAADVETSFDGVRLEGVEGDAKVKTEHGEVIAKRVGGGARVEASFARVELSEITGHAEVTVEHGGVRGDDLRGGASVRATGDGVELHGFRGALLVDVRNGGARLSAASPLEAPVSVQTEHGGIDLRVPAGSSFDLQATAEPGDVHVNVADFAASETGDSRIVGRAGQGGKQVTLAAQHGDVTVEPE